MLVYFIRNLKTKNHQNWLKNEHSKTLTENTLFGTMGPLVSVVDF